MNFKAYEERFNQRMDSVPYIGKINRWAVRHFWKLTVLLLLLLGVLALEIHLSRELWK